MIAICFVRILQHPFSFSFLSQPTALRKSYLFVGFSSQQNLKRLYLFGISGQPALTPLNAVRRRAKGTFSSCSRYLYFYKYINDLGLLVDIRF